MSKMSEARAYMPKVTVVPATLNRFTAAPIYVDADKNMDICLRYRDEYLALLNFIEGRAVQ